MRIDKRVQHNIVYALVVAILIALYVATMALNNSLGMPDSVYYDAKWQHTFATNQYARLGDSLLHGRLDLGLPVADELNTCSNPYDYEVRATFSSPDNPVFWDHAFYEGKYYCYFGVIPAIVVFIPFELLTGLWLSVADAILSLGILAIIAVAFLARSFLRCYFRDSETLTSQIVCLLLIFMGSNILYLGFVATFYSIPILSSLAATFFGMSFWMRAKVRGRDDAPSLRLPYLAAGSLLIAFNLGCRPQFILSALLAFPIFKDEIFHDRLLFSRKGIAATCVALVPFVVVFLPLCAYNYARFGSLFDFGNGYNLTGDDMLAYNQPKLLTLCLALTYTFQPVQFSSVFPFVEMTSTEFPFGSSPNEPFFGGFFLLKPAMFLAFAVPYMFTRVRKRKLFGLFVIAALLAVVILIIDARASITQRYFTDFGWYVGLCSCIGYMSLRELVLERAKPVLSRVLFGVLVVVFIFTLVLEYAVFFSPDHYYCIDFANPDLYQSVAKLFGA